ncbi:hypothetical protein LJ655_20920 [Paraburkholderia sp. MMS20-SJTN17]|uniref:Uncharacterized protein n=1 Tax=Paraburkholderia translucens TaxID=2886945 RepID=A0ABS8KHU8_9BURK|nr:hypothetical protein [Paraburkholderia sp. MMS20-SJTN17]MCC8404315.1 hypothetical protein [Paraburkholderia sp. MMS20-SJTN17]
MLRWPIAILIVLNVLAFVALRGAFGPALTAGARQPDLLNRQIHPDWLKVRPVSAADAADQAVVGGPAPQARISTSELPQ